MHRTTIMLPETLKLRAAAAAETQGISLGELIRKALEAELDNPFRSEDDILFSDRVTYSGKTPKNFASEHDRYLYDG